MNFSNPFRTSEPDKPLMAEAARLLITGGQSDPLRFLPADAAAKFERLQFQTEKCAAASGVSYRNMQDLREPIQNLELSIRQWERGPQTQYVAAMRNAACDEIQHLKQKRAEAQRRCDSEYEQRSAAMTLFDKVKKYCLKLTNPAAMAPPVSALPIKNGDYSHAVSAARNKVEKHKAELQSAHDAPVPSSQAREIVRAQIVEMAERGRVNVMPCIEAGRPGAFPGYHPYAQIRDVSDFLVWTLQDVLTARLESEIDSYSDDQSALTPQQRKTKIADAKAAILQAERAEEALIEAASAAGQTIARRADCDPRAVLQIEGPELQE